MSRIAYVNGRYVRHADARVHIEDRGYQFADGVYEVTALRRGRVIDEEPHLERLERSLDALAIPMPMARHALRLVGREVIRRNRVTDGILYTQATRGVAARDHPFPAISRTALVMTARPMAWPDNAVGDPGVGVMSLPDQRWARCDIKSVSLLPNVLAKQQARAGGAHEAWLVDGDGMVTEGASTNAWIVDGTGRVITRGRGPEILGGITRARIITLAKAAGIDVVERAFGIEEARAGAEAFLSSTTSLVRAVVHIDGMPIGAGVPGPVTLRLRQLYLDYCANPDGER